MATKGTVLQWVHGAEWAGTERHVWSLLEGLRARGWESVLGVSRAGPLTENARAAGFEVNVWPWKGGWHAFPALREWVEERRPQVVHVHSGYAPLRALRGRSEIRKVATRHGLHDIAQSGSRRLARQLGWNPARLADCTVAVCEHDRRIILETEGLTEDSVVVVYNGITPACRLAEQPDEPSRSDRRRTELRDGLGLPLHAKLLGFVGRLSPEKGADRFVALVESLGRARSSDRSSEVWRAVVCGTGPEEDRLRRNAAAAGIDEEIIWLGENPRGRDIVASLDVLAIPSRREGVPYVLLEALDAGVGVLATPVGGIPEILQGPDLEASCMEFEAESWAQAVSRCFRDGGDVWEQTARRRAGEFSETAMLDGLERVYRDVLLRGRE